jgi:putative tryptophan/tyrosine transport system substrate-binding protein
LLKEAIPGLSRVAYLWNPDVRGNLFDYKETESAACSLRLNPVMFASRTEFVGLALKKRLPSIYAVREYVSLGGLLSYGPSLPAMYRRAATFVDKVLKGAKPADLPVEQPTKFEFDRQLVNRQGHRAVDPPISTGPSRRDHPVIERAAGDRSGTGALLN